MPVLEAQALRFAGARREAIGRRRPAPTGEARPPAPRSVRRAPAWQSASAGRQAQQDGARAGVMPTRDPAWPMIPSGGGLPTPPPPSPPATAVARSSARRPPLPPSPLRAHALTAFAAVAVAAVAVAAVATAAARLLRRCSTGRRLLAAATPAAPLSITRRSCRLRRVISIQQSPSASTGAV